MSATDNRSPLGDTVTNWLHHLYGHAEAGWLTLFSVDATTGDRFTDWAPIIDTSDAVAHATTRATTCDVWFGVATRTEPLGANRRGGGPDCAGLPGLWLDIDIVGPGHRQGGRLATDEPAARALLDAFPLPATAVVHSGGGLQAWWLFAEMVPVDDQALTLLAAWGTTWSRIADAQGIDIDNVFDVARVMRLPGTTNRKEGGARPVTVTDADWDRRYGLDDLDQHLDAPPAPPAHRTGTAVPYIGPERPGTAYNVRHTGGDVLRSHGFTLARTDRNGDEHWTRPGKDTREGTSATVYADDGHTTFWSDTVATMWPHLNVRRPYDPFGLVANMDHGGDFSAARQALRTAGYGAAPAPTGTHISALEASVEPDADDWPELQPPDEADTLPPLPLDALPTWIADQVRNIARQLECDPILPFAFTLGALSVASLGHVQIAVRRGQIERSTGVYIAAAGPPASGKSPALSLAFAPVRDVEALRIAQAANAIAEADADHKILTKKAEEASNKAAKLDDDQAATDAKRFQVEAATIERPPAGEMMTSDITPERLATLMAANAERMAIVSDESGVLTVDRYGDKGNAKKLDIYLQGFTGEPVVVHRVKADTVRLARPLLAIVAGVQPQALATVLADTEWRTRGMGARFLIVSTDKIATNVDIDRDVWDETVGNTYYQRLRELATQWSSWAAPATLQLAPSARQTFSRWASDLLAREGLGGALEGESGWSSKMRTSTIRIAALLHLADGNPPQAEVSEATMLGAIRVAERFVAEFTAKAGGVDENEARLLSWLLTQRSDGEACRAVGRATSRFVARRDLCRKGPRGLRTRDEHQAALMGLAEAGVVRFPGVENMQVAEQVRRASTIEIHPDAESWLACATPRDTARQAPPEIIETTCDSESVAHVARVAYRGFSDPSLSAVSSLDPPSDPPPRATRATRATQSESHVIPPTDDPDDPDDDEGSLFDIEADS